MFGSGYTGWVRLTSGKSSGRCVDDQMKDGTMRLRGVDPEGKKFERIVQFRDGEIFDNLLKLEGKTVHHLVYGEFETKMTEKGREVTHFHPKTGKGLHGLARRWGTLFGRDGVCRSWYKRGRLVRQKFFYDNGRQAYDYNGFLQDCQVRDHEGNLLYEIKGALNGQNSCFSGCHSVFHRPMTEWFLQHAPFEVKQRGRVVYKGQWENRQRVGEWTEGGKKFFYERGVAIPAKLFRTPAEKLDPVKILSLPNAQLRMALCAKIGPEKIAKCGRVIHKDGAMRLLSIKGHAVNILRVQCPSTRQFYFLQVPKDTKECEEARQWTFGVGDGIDKPIKFTVET
jgi:hypothetical protein